MLVVILALIAVAVTATVVIRDAHQPVARHTTEPTAPPSEPAPERDPLDAPTEAVDMTQLVAADQSLVHEDPYDPPTQSMQMPVSFAGAQAAAILPYPASSEPVLEPVEPSAFVQAGRPHLQPDPDRLIQTEIVIDDVARAQKRALTKLMVGMAVSGAVIGLGVIGIARGIALLVHALTG